MRYSAAMASEKDDAIGDSTGWPAVISTSGRASLSGVAADQALTEQIARLFAAANAQLRRPAGRPRSSACRIPAWDRARCRCTSARR
jgi:hypothetical protein